VLHPDTSFVKKIAEKKFTSFLQSFAKLEIYPFSIFLSRKKFGNKEKIFDAISLDICIKDYIISIFL